MARWRLTAAHYLPVKGTTYRFSEGTLGGGQEAEQNLPVPRLLDPNTPRDWNSPEGIITVAHEGSRVGRDYVFVGDPTPDMEPLDEEAEAISGALRAKWGQQNTVDLSQSSDDYAKVLMDKLMTAPAPKAPDDGIKAYMESNQKTQEQMVAILAQLASRPEAVRRV